MPALRICVRSIPACAGEPTRTTSARPASQVYPRVCGGTGLSGGVAQVGHGLSPRVRGNPAVVPALRICVRSIPACAGEPTRTTSARPASQVYPRVCGGTSSRSGKSSSPFGLSPRVRGNPHGDVAQLAAPGSIPACAGEPAQRRHIVELHGVYPRVCGGTGAAPAHRGTAWGLSPRVRGNRAPLRVGRPTRRSIPACAGEPRRKTRIGGLAAVYPRVCGGTILLLPVTAYGMGLSPRVRGNRIRAIDLINRQRSIPACAGEPIARPARASVRGVYPRVCGGTEIRISSPVSGCGLSPRVRGNPIVVVNGTVMVGSIPACAGEPPVGRITE